VETGLVFYKGLALYIFDVDLKAFQKLTLLLEIGYYSTAYLLLMYRRKFATNRLRQDA